MTDSNQHRNHFLKTGLLSPERGRLISRMQRDREDADYMTGAVFTDHEAEQEIADAERFLDDARRRLISRPAAG